MKKFIIFFAIDILALGLVYVFFLRGEPSSAPVVRPDGMYQPQPGTSWQWQLAGNINTSYAVDLYDVDLVDTPQSIIDELHAREINVICYFSAGSFEAWRDDASAFPRDVLGKTLEGFPDERWLDVSSYEAFASVMQARLDLARAKQCDGVEPDNVDGYQNDTGFQISYDEQLAFNTWLAGEAHERGLSIALKNDLEQIPDLVDMFDFAVNEQCFEFDECEALLPFIEANKAVLGVEYELEPRTFCSKANAMRFSWLKMDLDLDGGRFACE